MQAVLFKDIGFENRVRYCHFGVGLFQKEGSCHKHQKPQAPTPQAPIRNRQTRKVTNA